MNDVLMLTRADHANTGWRFSKCLESLGLDVICYKAIEHPFAYPEQMRVHPLLARAERTTVRPTILDAPDMYWFVHEAKVIHFHATTFVKTSYPLKKENKKVVVQHAGDNYRKNPEGANKLFNPIVDKTICQYPSLLGLGAKNEELIYYPVDTNGIQPRPWLNIWGEKVVIGHWPSSPKRKGTHNILLAIDRLKQDPFIKNKFCYAGVESTKKGDKIAPWNYNLERMSQCDIIVERCQIGDGHSEWANTAIEAAALGKVVVTNSISSDLYVKEYGEVCPFFIANDENELISVLKDLITMPREKLYDHAMGTRKWVVDNHSMRATAKRLWEKVYKDFFE